MKKEKLKGHKNSPVNTVAWSADSQILASGTTDMMIRLWNREGDSIKVIDTPDYEVTQLAWSSDGILASVGAKKLRLWDAAGNQKKEIDADAYNCVAWSPDAKLIATNTIDHKTKIWNAGDGTLVKELEAFKSYVNGIGWNKDGSMFVAVSDGKLNVRYWDPSSWAMKKELQEHYESYTSFAWAPDGKNFAVGAWTYSKKAIRIYDLEGQSDKIYQIDQDKSMSLDWSEKWIVSGSSDKTIVILKPDGTVVETEKVGKAITGVAISPDNQALAVSCWDKIVYMYDLSEL